VEAAETLPISGMYITLATETLRCTLSAVQNLPRMHFNWLTQ